MWWRRRPIVTSGARQRRDISATAMQAVSGRLQQRGTSPARVSAFEAVKNTPTRTSASIPAEGVVLEARLLRNFPSRVTSARHGPPLRTRPRCLLHVDRNRGGDVNFFNAERQDNRMASGTSSSGIAARLRSTMKAWQVAQLVAGGRRVRRGPHAHGRQRGGAPTRATACPAIVCRQTCWPTEKSTDCAMSRLGKTASEPRRHRPGPARRRQVLTRLARDIADVTVHVYCTPMQTAQRATTSHGAPTLAYYRAAAASTLNNYNLLLSAYDTGRRTELVITSRERGRGRDEVRLQAGSATSRRCDADYADPWFIIVGTSRRRT